MIQKYLNEQFIQTTEDANFEKLKKTCADVAKKISKDKAKILTYSLIAFDPNIPADNKDITEIKNLIIENWQTFLSNSKDTTLTIIRAVMLDALHTSSKEISSACLIWYSCRNTLKHYQLGREENILASFLLELGNKIEAESVENWDFSPDYQIEIPKVTTAVIDDADFAGGFTQASVKDAVNKAFKKQVTELKEKQQEFVELVGLMQMRTHLLWWKEAGYSPALKANYKGMKDGLLQVLLAYDYSQFIPEMYPESADYFLLETQKNLSPDPTKKVKISEFLALVEQNCSDLKNFISESSSTGERISFANFIKGLIHQKYQPNQFKNLVGILETTELTFGELTLWIFHDLHSQKLSNTK